MIKQKSEVIQFTSDFLLFYFTVLNTEFQHDIYEFISGTVCLLGYFFEFFYLAAMLGAGEKSIVEAFWTCITHPFKALGKAIRNIKYEVDDYRN